MGIDRHPRTGFAIQQDPDEFWRIAHDCDRGKGELLGALLRERNRLRVFLHDVFGFVMETASNEAQTERERMLLLASTLEHDIDGILHEVPCFLPKVSGYGNRLEQREEALNATGP